MPPNAFRVFCGVPKVLGALPKPFETGVVFPKVLGTEDDPKAFGVEPKVLKP